MKKILIVADDVELGELLASILERSLTYPKPTVILGARRGKMAIETEIFALLLISRPLPDGDASEVVKLFRKLNPQAPVVVMSEEFAPNGDMRAFARQCGVDGAFPKPFLPIQLVDALRDAKVTPFLFR